MSYLEELRKSRNKAQVAYQAFILSVSKMPECLFCFFEGKDNGYYIPRIKMHTNKYYPIPCGGREKVLDVYRLISNHREYDSYKKAFFVDRDFNKPLGNIDVYETPCYSIENFYVSSSVFKEILVNEFHLSEVNDQDFFETCLNLFLSRQIEFHNATILLNSWYACLIDIKNVTGQETGVALNDKLPKHFIEFTLESIVEKYDFNKIRQEFPAALPVSEDILAEKLKEFMCCEQHKIFRGKYELGFLIKFIELLLKDANSKSEKIKFAFGDAANLNNEQALKIFSAYAETPECLVSYLKGVL